MQDTHDDRTMVAQIAQIAPELDVRSVRREHGQFNDVVIVNEAWVFRFPRSQAAAQTLQREVATLRALAGRLTLAIPAPSYASDDPALSYMGYALLPGAPLRRDALEVASDSALERLARQMVDFLGELHGLPLALLPDSAVRDTRDYWAEMFAGFRDQLFPHMRPDAREQVTRAFAAFLDDSASGEWTPVIRHGDLGGDNILHDADANALTGVIDFASTALGDAAIDLASLSSLGERMLTHLLAAWPAAASLLPRARFYRSTFALQEAYYGLRDGDVESFESGIARYR
jgi:aminoglycoside 2''-phosphotransferase